MVSKSQRVFDEVGYNLSNETVKLIKSIDKAVGTSTDDGKVKELEADILEKTAEIKRLEKEVESLRKKIDLLESRGKDSGNSKENSDDDEEE